MASQNDLKRISELVDLGVYASSADWSDAWHNWIVAELDGEVVACVQLCLGKPVGRLELLSVDESIGHRERALVVYTIATAGLVALYQTGSSIATAFISHDDKGFKKLIKRKFAATVTNNGNLLTTFLG